MYIYYWCIYIERKYVMIHSNVGTGKLGLQAPLIASCVALDIYLTNLSSAPPL